MPEMLQNSEGSRSLPEKKFGNGVPPHYTTANNALLASYKVAHRIAKCKEPHTISELIPSIAVDMGNLMIGESAELSAHALMKSKYRLKINVEKKTFILIQRIEKTCGKSGSSIPQIIVMQFVESAHFQLVFSTS